MQAGVMQHVLCVSRMQAPVATHARVERVPETRFILAVIIVLGVAMALRREIPRGVWSYYGSAPCSVHQVTNSCIVLAAQPCRWRLGEWRRVCGHDR